jgi:hypothetical protein
MFRSLKLPLRATHFKHSSQQLFMFYSCWCVTAQVDVPAGRPDSPLRPSLPYFADRSQLSQAVSVCLFVTVTLYQWNRSSRSHSNFLIPFIFIKTVFPAFMLFEVILQSSCWYLLVSWSRRHAVLQMDSDGYQFCDKTDVGLAVWNVDCVASCCAQCAVLTSWATAGPIHFTCRMPPAILCHCHSDVRIQTALWMIFCEHKYIHGVVNV